MKILLVGGFLGSGKTSLILQLAHNMVNKADLVDAETLEAVKQSVLSIRPGVPAEAVSSALPLPEQLLEDLIRE